MDDNKQAMIAADEFDADTMLVMFEELRAKQIRVEAEGGAGMEEQVLSAELRQMIDAAKASGVSRCPIRDVQAQAAKCPVDFQLVSPEEAKAAAQAMVGRGD
jgi:hypothetical protein